MDDNISVKSTSKFRSLFKSRSSSRSSSTSSAPRRKLQKAVPPLPSQNAVTTTRSTNGQKKPPINRYVQNDTEDDAYTAAIDKQTGERKDYTNMLHSLGLNDPFEAGDDPSQPLLTLRKPSQQGEAIIKRLSPAIWRNILGYLDLTDMSSLIFSCKAFRNLVGTRSWSALSDPENFQERANFLVYLDKSLPNHLLCFVCGKYHVRTARGREELKPANILNPLFVCPYSADMARKQPRMRIAPGRTLPFTFVQLTTRAERFTPSYGISADSLSRRWKHVESCWSHYTRYYIHPTPDSKPHLLMRVTSNVFASPNLPPSGQRYLLYSREDFWPYFSACSHWRDGDLMAICKCALSHVPEVRKEYIGPSGVAQRLQDHVQHQNPTTTHCSFCQPMRRCPECPTEYLIEIKLVEDKTSTDRRNLFKYALVVTRWSDLGDGSTPWSPEWAACNSTNINSPSSDPQPGLDLDPKSFPANNNNNNKNPLSQPSHSKPAAYNSFSPLVFKNRGISGIFESHFSPELIPGHRIISLNPKKEKKGEEGEKWY
ncbi:putative f-box domain protein [Phaeomoniella chlamydospora]|uniref:Putative f-box domain protein n=1 Tax=Phaeomoniella chlamydospora TaxID=158046 RepID=A0A0G2EAI2_PHACM|nr:putative f-box domain protein [Phaeomoniella chlamydospora]